MGKLKATINMGYINADIDRDFLADLIWLGTLSVIYEAKETKEHDRQKLLINKVRESLTLYNVLSGKEEDDAKELTENFLKLEKLI